MPSLCVIYQCECFSTLRMSKLRALSTLHARAFFIKLSLLAVEEIFTTNATPFAHPPEDGARLVVEFDRLVKLSDVALVLL